MFGYVREAENTLDLTVPDALFRACLAYYLQRSIFAECGSDLLISSDVRESDTVLKFKMSRRKSRTVICDDTFSSLNKATVRRKLRVKNGGEGVFVIGVTSQWTDLESGFYANTESWNYGYNGYSGNRVSQGKFTAYGAKYRTGDTI